MVAILPRKIEKQQYEKKIYFNFYPFNHILQFRQSFVGFEGFYKVIGPESILTSKMSFANSYWTETWANYLSNDYFGSVFNNLKKYPAAPLSTFNFSKFLALKFLK